MSFAVPTRSKREPGVRRGAGLARIFMKSMKELKQNKAARISKKEAELTNNTVNVSVALPHSDPKNLHTQDNKTESETVENQLSVLASHEVNVDPRKCPTERTETETSECDKVPSSTHVVNNSKGEWGSSMTTGIRMIEQDVQVENANNNAVERTSAQETVPVVKSEKSALCHKLEASQTSNPSVMMDKKVNPVRVKSAATEHMANKREFIASSRCAASDGNTNRSRQDRNSVLPKSRSRRYSQSRHSNNSRERVVEKLGPEDWNSDLLEIEIREGSFHDSNKTEKSSGFPIRCTKDGGKTSIGQIDQHVKDREENIGERESEASTNVNSYHNEREKDSTERDMDVNSSLTNADQQTTEERNEVNLEKKQIVDKSLDNIQSFKKSLDMDVIVEKRLDNERIGGNCLDKGQTNGKTRGKEPIYVVGKTLDTLTENLDTKQLEGQTSTREDVSNSVGNEQSFVKTSDPKVVAEITDCGIKLNSEKEKTACESKNIGVKNEEDYETQTFEKLETAGSSLVRSEKNTATQFENVLLRNEVNGHVSKEQQPCKVEGEPILYGGKRQEIQGFRKDEPVTCCGHLGGMDDGDGNRREEMRIETPPLRVPVCDIPAYYNRRRNSGTLSDTSNTSHSSSQKIPSKDIGCCISWESKTPAPTPSLLGVKCSPWRDYSSASSDSSYTARSSKPRPKKPKRKSRYNKSIARGHSLTVSPLQKSPAGSPTSRKDIRGRQPPEGDVKSSYDNMIHSKIQAMAVEMKAKAVPPTDSGGRTRVAKPMMYRDSLRAMKQVISGKTQRKNISAGQVLSEQRKQETSKTEPVVTAQANSEPRTRDCSESIGCKNEERRRRNNSESTKEESSDSKKQNMSKPIIIPQVSSEPKKEDILKSTGDNAYRHIIIPQVSSEPKCPGNLEHAGHTLENTGRMKSDSRIRNGSESRNHHHTDRTTDGSLRSGFQNHSEMGRNLKDKAKPTGNVFNRQESINNVDQRRMELRHQETSQSKGSLNREPGDLENLQSEDHFNQESRHTETLESKDHLNQKSRHPETSETKDHFNQKSRHPETSETKDHLNQKSRHPETSESKDHFNEKSRHPETSETKDHLNQKSRHPETSETKDHFNQKSRHPETSETKDHFNQKSRHPETSECKDHLNQKSRHPETSETKDHFNQKSRHPETSECKDHLSQKSRHPETSESKDHFNLKSTHPETSESKDHFNQKSTHPETSESKDHFNQKSTHPETSESKDHFNQKSTHPETSESKDHFNEKSTHPETSESKDHFNQKSRHPETSESKDHFNLKSRHSETSESKDRHYALPGHLETSGFKNRCKTELNYQNTSESVVQQSTDLKHRDTLKSKDDWNTLPRCRDSSETEDHHRVERRNQCSSECQNLDRSKSRDYPSEFKKYNNPKSRISVSAEPIHQDKCYGGHNREENVRTHNSVRGHNMSEPIRPENLSQVHSSSEPLRRNNSFGGHNSSEHIKQDNSSRGHKNSEPVMQGNSSRGHKSSESIGQNNSSEHIRTHNSSRSHSGSEHNSCRCHGNSEPVRQDNLSQGHKSSDDARTYNSSRDNSGSEHIRPDNSCQSHNSLEHIRPDNSTQGHSGSEPIKQDNSSRGHKNSEPVRQDNSSRGHNSSNDTRTHNSTRYNSGSEHIRPDNSTQGHSGSEPIKQDNSSRGHKNSEPVRQDNSSRGHNSSDEARTYDSSEPVRTHNKNSEHVRQDNSSRGRNSSEPIRTHNKNSEHVGQDNLSRGHNSSESVRQNNSFRGHNRSELIGQEDSSPGHHRSEYTRQDISANCQKKTEPIRQDNSSSTYNRSGIMEQDNSSRGHNRSEFIRQDNLVNGQKTEPIRQENSSRGHNRSEFIRQDNSVNGQKIEPIRQENSSQGHNRSEFIRQDNSSRGHNRSEFIRQDNSSRGHNRSEFIRQDNSSRGHNRSEFIRQDNSSRGHNRSEFIRQENSSQDHNRSEFIRQDNSSQGHNRSEFIRQDNSSRGQGSSESRKDRNSESTDRNSSEPTANHEDSSGSRFVNNGFGSGRVVSSEPRDMNYNHSESVTYNTLKGKYRSGSQGNIGSEHVLKKQVSSDPGQPGQNGIEYKKQEAQKKFGEKLNVNVTKQLETSDYENWDTDLLAVSDPPDSSFDLSNDRVAFTTEYASGTTVGMLTSESGTEKDSSRKLEKLNKKEIETIPKCETASCDGHDEESKRYNVGENSLSGSHPKATHNQSTQDKVDQQQQNKCSEAKPDINNQVCQCDSRHFSPDRKINSVTFPCVRNDRSCQGQLNGRDTDTGQRNKTCTVCSRSLLKATTDTPRTSSFPKGEHLTMNIDGSYNVCDPLSDQQQNKSTGKQGNCLMEHNLKKSDYGKDMSWDSRDKHHLKVHPKPSKYSESGIIRDLKTVLVVQPNQISSDSSRSDWSRTGDQRKNEDRKSTRPWSDFARQQKPVLDESEENWDSHLLDIEGILKTHKKTENTEQVVPGGEGSKETSILSNDNPSGKHPDSGQRVRHQLQEWDSTLLDLNVILKTSDSKKKCEEDILPERHFNNKWCEVQVCEEIVSKVESCPSSDCATSACVDNVEEEDGSIIPQSDSSSSETRGLSEFEDVCTSDDVMESYVFLSQEECCAPDVALDSTSCTQASSTDLEMEKLCRRQKPNSPGTIRPPVSSHIDRTKYARDSDEKDFRDVENYHGHRPDSKRKKGSPPGYDQEECVCPPACVQFWTWRCCSCRWGWEPRICDIRSALDFSDCFTPSSIEDQDSTENGLRMRYSPRGILAMRSNRAIPPPPSRELWNQMQQGTTPATPVSPMGTGVPSYPANMPHNRTPYPRMQFPGSYPFHPEYGSPPQQVLSCGMRHCSPYRLQFRQESPHHAVAPVHVELNVVEGKPSYSCESSGHVSFVSKDHAKRSHGKSEKQQNLWNSSTGSTGAKEVVSSDEMQDLQLNSPKLVDYGFSETDDSEEDKKDPQRKSKIALFGKDDQSQDSDCSSEKRKLELEEGEINDEDDCSATSKRRHVVPKSNIYHFIRHSLNSEPNTSEDDHKATAYVPPHRRQKIDLTDRSDRDGQRAKDNKRKTPIKQATSNDQDTEVSSPASKPSQASPGSYPWTPFWASPSQAMSMPVSPLYGYHQPPCMYPPSCYFSQPDWYHGGSGTDSYGGAYPQPTHSHATSNAAVKSSTKSPDPTKENVPELSRLQADAKCPERLVLPPRRHFLERTRLLGHNTDSESSSSFPLVDWKANFKEKCKTYCGTYIDSHCHLDFLFNRSGFRGTWSKYKIVHEATMPHSFEGCVAVFCHPGSFRQEGLWKEVALEEDVWLAFGCHPKHATEFSPRAEAGLIRCLQHKKVVALGEIGLDYSGIFKQHQASQKIVFIKQIQLALEMNKPLVIHCREAEEDCLQILEETVPRNYRIHCHCFTGDYESAKKWMNLFPNLYIGLTPLVTYRTATPTHEVARFIPLDRLLLETDAPYFIPRKFPKEDVPYSHPGMAITVAEHVAFLKRCSVTEVLHACRQNTRNMYGV